MARSVNKIIVIGHVGRDPEVFNTKSGKKVARISVATSRKVGDDERTDWHRVVAWEQSAAFVEDYVRKGDRVYVEGRMEYGSYEKDGVNIPTAEIVAREVMLLTQKNRVQNA